MTTKLDDLERYVTGELPDDEAAAFEDALFAAPDDPAVLLLDRIVRHGAKLVEHGTYNVGVTRAEIEALIARGHSVQICDAGAPGSNMFSIDRTSEFIVTQLPLGRTDLERVDVEITLTDHGVTKTIADVLVDPANGTIWGLCERPLAELAFGTRSHVKVRAHTTDRPVIAEWYLVGQLSP